MKMNAIHERAPFVYQATGREAPNSLHCKTCFGHHRATVPVKLPIRHADVGFVTVDSSISWDDQPPVDEFPTLVIETDAALRESNL